MFFNKFQCAKLLADTNVIQFYPSKFVLITDILDTFGRLVYERLRTKSLYISPGSSKPQSLPGLKDFKFIFFLIFGKYTFTEISIK